jgi:predicted Zn-dependent protease
VIAAQDTFQQLTQDLQGLLKGGEVYTCNFASEDSDFVRFNKAEVRQAGHVSQRSVSIDLIEGSRHAGGSLTLCGDRERDLAKLRTLVEQLRERRAALPEDPHLLYATDVASTEQREECRLPEGRAVVDQVQRAAMGRDLVGIYASGGIHRGFASSLGQRNWYETYPFNFDWSFYHSTDKAVKTSYAGFDWQDADFERKVESAGEQLAVLRHPARTIEPGHYRAYLSPAALHDFVEMVAGSFSVRLQRTRQTPLLKLFEGEATLNAGLTVTEATSEGVAPNFQEAGFVRPDHVVLVDGGRPAELLVSPRSSREFGLPTNGASSSESPESVQVGAGELPTDRVLAELGTGLWIGNVWYLNWSDRSNCRTTGMTRFATFWVENGSIQCPVNVMRFDETAYRMLGDRLVGLTAERDWILDPYSYHARSTSSALVPGALVDDFTLTL